MRAAFGRERGIGAARRADVDGRVAREAERVEQLAELAAIVRGEIDRVVREPRQLAAEAGTDITRRLLSTWREELPRETLVPVRTPSKCESPHGVCQTCYGRALSTYRPVDVGEAVGIIAAQSIGEPGTQLTMRTFHTGGIAGEDITAGLPRVVELFEARHPKAEATLAEIDGIVSLEEADSDRQIRVVITTPDGEESRSYTVERQLLRPEFVEGAEVRANTPITEGAVYPHQILENDLAYERGTTATERYLVEEVQKVYRAQGVSIHDKHIEVIVRQMLRRVTIIDSGATEFLPGALAERADFETQNRRVVAEGGEPASGRPVLMGITKASLATESWLSAASFQETTRILTDAAINGKRDKLVGLKENVIIGKLIPAGSGAPANVAARKARERQAALEALAGEALEGLGEAEYNPFLEDGSDGEPGVPVHVARVRPVAGQHARHQRAALHAQLQPLVGKLHGADATVRSQVSTARTKLKLYCERFINRRRD